MLLALVVQYNDITSEIIDISSTEPHKPGKTTKEKSVDGFSSNDISEFSSQAAGKFIMYEFSQPKKIEKIHVRVRLNPDKRTNFNNITIEIGMTSNSLNVFGNYLEPTAKPRSLVTFTNPLGPMEGIKIHQNINPEKIFNHS